jgi:hypothetical protein
MPEESDVPKIAPDGEFIPNEGIRDSTPSQTKTRSADMEVHHHPELEKKSLKGYLLEGLMIFLAVTLGYFAENIRENYTEHERAEVYASSMLKDLEADTSQLRTYRDYFDYTSKKADTLMLLLAENDPKNIASGKLYWYGLFGGAHRYFVPNDATLQQMKSSGTLRYFDKTVANNVAKYDRFCRMMQTNEEMVRDIYTEIRKSRALIFDFRYNDMANNIYQANRISFNQQRIDSFTASNPPLLSYDRTLFNQYVELVRSRFMHTNLDLADSLIKQSRELISELRLKYNVTSE